jgi:hypothetical protein
LLKSKLCLYLQSINELIYAIVLIKTNQSINYLKNNRKSMKNNSKPIQPTLKNMNKYDKVAFDLKKATSVGAAIQTIQTSHGYKFTRERDNELGILYVIRTA